MICLKVALFDERWTDIKECKKEINAKFLVILIGLPTLAFVTMQFIATKSSVIGRNKLESPKTYVFICLLVFIFLYSFVFVCVLYIVCLFICIYLFDYLCVYLFLFISYFFS